jgi:hypothetical protein
MSEDIEVPTAFEAPTASALGEQPKAKGGRPKKYLDDNARQRACRERKLEKKLAAARAAGVGLPGKAKRKYGTIAEKSEAARKRTARREHRRYRRRKHDAPDPNAPVSEWKRYVARDIGKSDSESVELVTDGYTSDVIESIDEARRADLMKDYYDTEDNFPHHLWSRLECLLGEDAAQRVKQEAASASARNDTAWFRDAAVSLRTQVETAYRQWHQRSSENCPHELLIGEGQPSAL